MVNKYMKICPTSQAMEEIQIKMLDFISPLQRTVIKNTTTNDDGVLIKLKIELPYDPQLPCLGIYPKECKST
jgi:hypothetical protein